MVCQPAAGECSLLSAPLPGCARSYAVRETARRSSGGNSPAWPSRHARGCADAGISDRRCPVDSHMSPRIMIAWRHSQAIYWSCDKVDNMKTGIDQSLALAGGLLVCIACSAKGKNTAASDGGGGASASPAATPCSLCDENTPCGSGYVCVPIDFEDLGIAQVCVSASNTTICCSSETYQITPTNISTAKVCVPHSFGRQRLRWRAGQYDRQRLSLPPR